ncbi:MAG: RrF2 family transcriptional regulator [bacterium]|jgi:Rrf2 family protein
MYNRSTQDAISALSLLAEKYDGGKTLISSQEIAEKRNLPKPFVAKLLTMLSQARLVSSIRGPGGGYTLAVPPAEISFYDVSRIFEREGSILSCPFGRDYCGNQDPCPLHHQIEKIQESIESFLKNTHFDIFQSKGKKSKEKNACRVLPIP